VIKESTSQSQTQTQELNLSAVQLGIGERTSKRINVVEQRSSDICTVQGPNLRNFVR